MNADSNAIVLLRQAVDMLDEVQSLLEALSPGEILAAMGEQAMFWQHYESRHRSLSQMFRDRRAAFVRTAQAFLEGPSTP
jgi:hypothetical protein